MLLVIISQTGSLNGKIDAYRLNMFFLVVYNEVKTTKNLVLMGLSIYLSIYLYIPRYSFSGYIYIYIYIYIHPPSGSRYIFYWFIKIIEPDEASYNLMAVVIVH